MIFRSQDRTFDFAIRQCMVFGIVNVTPDSFSDGGRYHDPVKAVAHGLRLEKEGADALDVGGESTRPGAAAVSVEEEMSRVVPVIEALCRKVKIPVSVDTTKATVAEAAFKAGASILNDVSGLTADPAMFPLASRTKAGVILMHRRGNSSTMQSLCDYGDVVEDVARELSERLEAAKQAGMDPERLALDPGMGFAKTAAQSMTLLRDLTRLRDLVRKKTGFEIPWMIGVSRKSFLGGELADRGVATLCSEIWGVLQGARMIRTHEPRPIQRALTALDPLQTKKIL